MKRQQRVDDFVRAVADVDARHGAGGFCLLKKCGVCKIVDELAEILVKFETDEALDRGADLVDAEPIS